MKKLTSTGWVDDGWSPVNLDVGHSAQENWDFLVELFCRWDVGRGVEAISQVPATPHCLLALGPVRDLLFHSLGLFGSTEGGELREVVERAGSCRFLRKSGLW